jgi:ribose-phosphate pyrophosphokinase
VGLWVHFKTLIGLGIDHMITYNLHSDMSVSMVDPACCAMDNIPAVSLLKRHINRRYVQTLERLRTVVRDSWLFGSVDAGGEVLAKRFASSFNTPMVVAHKQRDYSAANRVQATHVLSGTPLEGKVVWIVDDILDTGGSVYGLVQELRSRGVRKVNVVVVHPVCSPPALERLERLHEDGLLDRVLTTDTVRLCPEDLERHRYVEVISSAALSAEIIHRLHADTSLSELFSPFDPQGDLRATGESLVIEA